MNYNSGDDLVKEFNASPESFIKNGLGFKLLNTYFKGYPVDSLRQFLLSTNPLVRREAASILSELGNQGQSLIDAAILLVDDNDVRIQYDALESIFLCSYGKEIGKLAYVVRAFDASSEVIRNLAMNLVSNADVQQLTALLPEFTEEEKDYKDGILTLLKEANPHPNLISKMILDKRSVTRKFGVILLKKSYAGYPGDLLNQCLTSNDNDIRVFAEEFR
jgi:hypothetical protein